MAKFKSKIKTVLEMGTYETRLMILESAEPGEIRLKKCLSVDTSQDFVASTFIENPIMDPEPIKEAVTSLVASSGVGYENTFLMLPDHIALVDVLIAPPRYSKAEGEEALKENFEPIMPLPFDHWFLSHETVGVWEEDEITLAIASLKNNVLEIGGIVQKAGINPFVVDINFLNVANLIENHLISSENADKNMCLIHLGHESTSIGVFRDGVIRSFQNRPVGAYDFTKQISKHFHVPDAEADQFKRNEIFFLPEASSEQDGLYNFTVIKNTFSVLSREIFSAIESYLTKYREFNIHEVIISGGGACFENISVVLASNLNTKVTPISNYYNLYVNGNAVSDAEKNSLAAACGCFLRGN